MYVLSVYQPFVGKEIICGFASFFTPLTISLKSFLKKGSPPAREYQRRGPLCLAEFTKIFTGSSPGSFLSKVSL